MSSIMYFLITGQSQKRESHLFNDLLLYSIGSGQISVSKNTFCSLRKDICIGRRALYLCSSCSLCPEFPSPPCLLFHVFPNLQGLKGHGTFFCSPAQLSLGLPLLCSTHHNAFGNCSLDAIYVLYYCIYQAHYVYQV